MKSLALILGCSLPLFSFAQGVFTNQTHSTLQQVISDFPHHFKNIKGERMNADPQTTDYASSVRIPGAINTVITQYSSDANQEIYSWKTLLYESEEFDAVAAKYRELYAQIRNSIIKVEGEKPFILNGTYEVPTEEKRFATSVFYLLPASGDMQRLRVELGMQYYVTEWKVSLTVYDQEEERVVME